MYNGLLHLHSGLRWIVLILILIAIFNSLRGKDRFGPGDARFPLLAMITTHIQLLVGFSLYFISPKVVFASESMKDPILRFFLVEHLAGMLIAIALITIGYSRMKRALEPKKKHRQVVLFYLIGLAIMLISSPWPFTKYAGGWG